MALRLEPRIFTRGPPGLVDEPAAVEQARLDWGEGSPLWQVRILGEFPSETGTSLISLTWLEAAAKLAA